LIFTAKAREQVLGLGPKNVEVPTLQQPPPTHPGDLLAAEDCSRTMKRRLDFSVDFLHNKAQPEKSNTRLGDYTSLLKRATSDLTEFLVQRAALVGLVRQPDDI
jgi:hypothetical protein